MEKHGLDDDEDPMELPVWILLQVFIWMRSRNPDLLNVRMKVSAVRKILDETSRDRHLVNQLRNLILDDKLQAYGYRMTRKELALTRKGLRLKDLDDEDDEPAELIREAIPRQVWLDVEIKEWWIPPPPNEYTFGGLYLQLPGIGYRTAWRCVVFRRVDILAAFPEETELLSRKRQEATKPTLVSHSQPYWRRIDGLIYECLVDDGVPNQRDGGQARLEKLAMSEAEAMGHAPAVSTVRRHVKQVIQRRLRELQAQ